MSSKITNPQIDQLYDEALKAGAWEANFWEQAEAVTFSCTALTMCSTRWLPAWSRQEDSWRTGILNCAAPELGGG